MSPDPTSSPPPTDPTRPGPAADPHTDSVTETRRLLAEAKAAFAAEQAAADAEEEAAGPSVFARGKKLVDDVRDDPVQAVADRLDDRLGNHKKAVAIGLVAGGTVLLLQNRWVRKRALPIVASAGAAMVQDRIREWFSGGGEEEAGAEADADTDVRSDSGSGADPKEPARSRPHRGEPAAGSGHPGAAEATETT